MVKTTNVLGVTGGEFSVEIIDDPGAVQCDEMRCFRYGPAAPQEEPSLQSRGLTIRTPMLTHQNRKSFHSPPLRDYYRFLA